MLSAPINDRWGSTAGQPLTFGGVAAFAQASWTRFLVVQSLVALVAAGIIVWFIISAWDPVIRSAIAHLPDDGEIRDGVLIWRGPDYVNLAAPNSFLSFHVNLAEGAEIGAMADLQFEFARNEMRLRSILGYFPIRYPTGWLIALNRIDLEPWWGAWRPAVCVAVGTGVILVLFASWAAMGTIYCVPVWIIGFYADRRLTWPGAWRLASAALLPGALFMSAAIAAYGVQQINLLQLLFALAIHFAIAWIYVCGAPFRLPRLNSKVPRKNPFAGR